MKNDSINELSKMFYLSNETNAKCLNNILVLCYENLNVSFQYNKRNNISIIEALTFIKSMLGNNSKIILQTLNALNNSIEGKCVLAYNVLTKRFYICNIKNNQFINCCDIQLSTMEIEFFVYKFSKETQNNLIVICELNENISENYSKYNMMHFINNGFIKIINPKQNKELYAIVIKSSYEKNDDIKMKFLYMYMKENVYLFVDYTVQPDDYLVIDIDKNDYVPDIVINTMILNNIKLSKDYKFQGLTYPNKKDFNNKLIKIIIPEGVIIGKLVFTNSKVIVSSPILISNNSNNSNNDINVIDDYDITYVKYFIWSVPDDDSIILYNSINTKHIRNNFKFGVYALYNNKTYRILNINENSFVLTDFKTTFTIDACDAKQTNKSQIAEMLGEYFNLTFYQIDKNEELEYSFKDDILYLKKCNTYIPVYINGEWKIFSNKEKEQSGDYEILNINEPATFKFYKKNDKVYFRKENIFVHCEGNSLKITLDETNIEEINVNIIRNYKSPIKKFNEHNIYALNINNKLSPILPINDNEGFLIIDLKNIKKVNINTTDIFYEIHI